MTVRQLGGGLGVLGGIVWIARWLMAPADGPSDVLRYAGLVLVLLGLVCVGLTLVKGQALWLDIVVGFAVPALFWALYEMVRAEVASPGLLFHGILGIAWVLVGIGLIVKGKPRVDEQVEAHV